MRKLFIATFSLLVILAAVYTSAFTSLVYGARASQGQSTTALYLNRETSPKEIIFTLENRGNSDRAYTYEIYTATESQESLEFAGSVGVPGRSSSVTFYPLANNRTEKVRVTVIETGEELKYYTGYQRVPETKPKEWAPQIEPDLPWERQDPIVRHYYRYVTGQSRDYNYRR
jgi:hypothetical protein